MAMSYRIDEPEVRRRALRLSRLTHPDFFAAAGARDRELAERATAIVNEAQGILSDDARRADWILARLGGPSESEERSMSPEFLQEVLDWNELLDEARTGDSIPVSRLEELRDELGSRRVQSLAMVEEKLDPLPAPGSEALRQVRRELNTVRYVDRALGEIETLRLARAEAG